MEFDYKYTCPNIDISISDSKRNIMDYLNDMISECCPMLDGEQKDKFIESYTDSIYDALSPIFEDVRGTNSDIRDYAEKCINELNDEIESLKDDKVELCSEVEDLEDRISKLLED